MPCWSGPHCGPLIPGAPRQPRRIYRREASRPNEIWQADHTPLDIWIVDDRGQPARPWLTIIIDDYSRVIASFRVGLEVPTALGTALTLRQAIWRKADPRWQ